MHWPSGASGPGGGSFAITPLACGRLSEIDLRSHHQGCASVVPRRSVDLPASLRRNFSPRHGSGPGSGSSPPPDVFSRRDRRDPVPPSARIRLQRAVAAAARTAAFSQARDASRPPRFFRHPPARRRLRRPHHPEDPQILGHKDIRTTMIHTTSNRGGRGVRSPFDQ